MINSYWADSYVEKKCDAKTAMLYIRPGQRVFIGSSSGEPQHLVKALAETAARYTDIEIVRLMALESTPLTHIAEKNRQPEPYDSNFLSRVGQSQTPVKKSALYHTCQSLGGTPSFQKPAPSHSCGTDPGNTAR